MTEDREANFIANKQDFAYFLGPEEGKSIYAEKVQKMLGSEKIRLIVDLNHVNQYDPALRRSILERPLDYLPAWEEALKDYIDGLHLQKEMGQTFKIGLEGSFGAHRVTPQQLMAHNLTQMVCLEGIVTKISLVRPKVVQTVHYCDATKQYHSQSYRDATAMTGLPTSSAYPTKDTNGNPLTTEYGLSTYRNHQKVYVQDMPERTVAGSMPQTVECLLDDDLVDICKPGDRVQMIGIYRALAGKVSATCNGKFKTVLLINNVCKLGVDDKSRLLSVKEIRMIRNLAKRSDIFDLLARSIAPSIYGHEFIKKAIVLQLLGGNEKNLENGTHIRGDINILMVGDPSCAKSQMLRAVMNLAPLAINTTGRGSSGVGLTAAVTQDRETSERRLEAGAMVLADRGVVCIDEFDKMSDIDRTAIHEVMEQQTVTIAKAGIHTSLNARCSVIAAANPIYGQYNKRMLPHQNIALPDSLLSRFDLLFIVLDKIDSEIDLSISEHVLNMHLTPHQEHPDSLFDDFEMQTEDDETVDVFEKNPIGSKRNRSRDKGKQKDFLTVVFCKKYLEFSKKQYKPVLTDEACRLISKLYSELRSTDHTQTLPITARCLETIIRLSTAVAKLKLRKTIEEEHVEEAMRVLRFALTNDVEPIAAEQEKKSDKSKKKQAKYNGGKDGSDDELFNKKTNDDDNDNDNENDNDGQSTTVMEEDSQPLQDNTNTFIPTHKNPRKRAREGDKSSTQASSDNITQNTSTTPRAKRLRPNLNSDTVQTVTQTLSALFRKTRNDIVTVEALAAELDASNHSIPKGELDRVLRHLSDTNKVFLVGDSIHQV